MSSIQQDNLDHPLIHWVKAVYTDGRKIEYSDLFDGVLLNDLMNIVDSSPDENLVCKDACDFNTRLFNWDLLLKSIQAYYKDVLQVYLCVVCPDIYLISREPETDSSFKEVCKVLLLILGCAVQGEHREDFIFNIKQLDVTIQHAIVSYIQEITDESVSILPREKNYSDDEYIDKIINHVERLLKERDSLQYAHMVFNHENKTQQVHDQSDVSEKSAKPETESADKKIKVRVLQTQLDEKDEQISDLRDENEEVRRSLLSLKTEHLDLVQKFHSLRSLQDDLDAFKEKASKADSLEEEVAVLKKKLNEVEFYKARIQELQDDNSVLEETKTFLEDQVGSTHVRLETVSKLEIELKKNKLLLDEYCLKINLDSEKISALTQENVELQREMSLLVEKKLAHEANLSIDGFDNPISAELQESANVSKLQLELEIQRLNQQLNITEEEFGNLRLQIKNYEESEQEQIKLGYTYRLKKLETENVTLNEKLKEKEKSRESLQHQSNVVESEKKMLREEIVKIKKNQVEVVASLEVENKNLKKKIQKVDAQLSEVQVKAVDCENILKENHSLQSQLQNVSISEKDKQDKLEEQEEEFSVEIQKLQQQLISGEGELMEMKFKSDNLQIENTNLQDKLKHFEQTLQSMQNKSEESKDIRSEIIILQQELTQKENNVQELNSELKQLQSGNERLQEKLELSEHNVKSLRGKSEDLNELQSEIIDLDDELENKDKEVQELKTKMKDLAEVQTDKELIQTQLKTTEKKVISLRSKTEEMHSMIVDLQQEVSNKDVEVMDLSAKVKTLESETGKQQKEFFLNIERQRLSSRAKSVDSVEMQSEILSLQQELQSKEQDVLELKSKVTELEKLQPEVEWLEQVVMTTEEELEKLKLKTDTDTEIMEFDNRRLQQELDVTKEDLGILHDKSTCNDSSEQLLTESVNNLESENKELCNQLKMAAAELQALKMEASKYSEGEKMVNESLNQVEFENEKLIEQLNMAEDELDMIKEKLSESEIVKRSLYEENRNFNESQCESFNLLEVENQSLTERLDTAERELEIFRGKDIEIEILQQANVQLESQITRSEKKPQVETDNRILEHTQELQEYVAREERLHVVISENQTLNKKLRDLEEDCQQLRHHLRKSEKERQSWEEKNENVTDSQTRSLIKLHNENQDVINQLQLADKEIKQLKNENECSETIKFAQSEQLNEVQVENQKFQEQVQEAEFEVKSLQQQLIAFETEIGIHKEEKMSFDSDVTESLNQLQNENETLIKQLQLAVDELINMKKKLEVADEYKILYDESVKINEEKADVMNELSIRNDELTNHLQQAQDDIQSMNQKLVYSDKRQHSETQKSSPRQDIMENGHQHIPQSYIRKQNTIIARLQIQNTAIQCQFASLINQNSTLQNQMALLESEHENVLINHEELQIAHEHVLCDHEKLQKIHELLSLEYEDLVSEYVLTRTRLNIMHRDIIKPNCPVEKEIDGLSSSSSNELRGYNYKYNRQDIGEHPEDTYDSLEDPFEDFSAIDQDMQQMELNFNILHQIKNTLEEENQALLLQLQQLLNQNQELLTSAIDNKDYFNEEEKSYIEKLAELRRKKERLEEKLMAHYGNPKDSPKKNRGFSALLKRVRALILKSQKNKNKSSLETQNSVSQLNVNNNNSGSKQDSDDVPKYHSNFETDIDPEKLTLVEFLTEGMDKLK